MSFVEQALRLPKPSDRQAERLLLPLLDVLQRTFLPGVALTGAEEGAPLRALAAVTPLAMDRASIDGRAAAYVCERGACRLPATTPDALRAELEPVRPYP